MKVLVTGSVYWTDPGPIEQALQACLAEVHLGSETRLIVLTGMADGADAIAHNWARRNAVPVLAEPLTAGTYPGPMHTYNHRMLAWKPDLVLAFKADFDPCGRPDAGTEHMCRIALAAGVSVRVHPGSPVSSLSG